MRLEADIGAERSAHQATLERRDRQLAYVRDFADDLREELDQRADQVRSRDIEIARLAGELREARRESDRLAEQLAAAEDKLAIARHENECFRTAQIQMRGMKERIEAERDEWQQTANDRLAEAGQLQAALESAQRILRVMWPAAKETPDSISQWATETFGDETGIDLIQKLLVEVVELDRVYLRPGPQAVEELADVLIILCRVFSIGRFADLGATIDAKMAINRLRLWRRRPDGTWRHVPEVAV